MGTFVFSRCNEDMFNFFRSQELKINDGYFEEQLKSISTWGGCKPYSSETMRKDILKYAEMLIENDYVKDAFNDLKPFKQDNFENVAAFENAFRKEISDHFAEDELDENRYVTRIESYSSEYQALNEVFFDDIWACLGNGREYSYQYIWCCYAVVWAIQQYDATVNG